MLTVHVEKSDIDAANLARGVEMSRLSCPLAQALKRMYPQSMVSVGTECATIDSAIYTHGELARRLVWRFDCMESVSPTVVFLIEREDRV